MSGKRYFFLVIALTLVSMSIPASVVVIGDPNHIFHKPLARPVTFSNLDRYQNAGLINSWINTKDSPYEGIVIGTSMSQNFDTAKLSKSAGLTGTIRLTIAGGRPRELAAVARKPLEGGRIKFVLWEFYKGYDDINPQTLHPKSPLPLYLYEGNTLDHWRYVFNQDIFRASARFYLKPDKARADKGIDEIYRWDGKKQFAKWSSADNIKRLRAAILQSHELNRVEPESERNTYPSVDENLLSIIRDFPAVKFRIFFPPIPYTTILKRGSTQFWRAMAIRRYLVHATSTLKNVTVSTFDLVPGIGDTVTEYKDSTHYRPRVNDFMARNIENEKYRLNDNNFEQYLSEFRKNVNGYREQVIAGERLVPTGH